MIPLFNYDWVKGKGVGDFLKNLVQVISNTHFNNKENLIWMKYKNEPKRYYQLIGFDEIPDNDKILDIHDVE